MYIQKIEPEKVIKLSDLIPIELGSVSSKTLVQYKDVGVTLFSLDKNESISSHTAPGDALVTLLSGKAKITINSEEYIVNIGDSILMPANVPHALFAEESFQMLLLVIKSEN